MHKTDHVLKTISKYQITSKLFENEQNLKKIHFIL